MFKYSFSTLREIANSIHLLISCVLMYKSVKRRPKLVILGAVYEVRIWFILLALSSTNLSMSRLGDSRHTCLPSVGIKERIWGRISSGIEFILRWNLRCLRFLRCFRRPRRLCRLFAIISTDNRTRLLMTFQKDKTKSIGITWIHDERSFSVTHQTVLTNDFTNDNLLHVKKVHILLHHHLWFLLHISKEAKTHLFLQDGLVRYTLLLSASLAYCKNITRIRLRFGYTVLL